MKCLQCNVENEENAKFCSSCGVKIEDNNNRKEIFKDTKVLTNLTRYFLYIFILSSIVNTYFGINEFMIWKNVENGLVFESEAQALVAIYAGYNLYNTYFRLFSFLVLFILVPMWIYRVNKNSKSLGALNMRFSPAWSIVWYFIPIFNLWKPYQAMKELYQTSVNPTSWESVKVTRYLSLWWTFWILSFFVGNNSTRGYNEAQTAHEFLGASFLWILSSLTELLSGVFLLIILNIIYKNQMIYSKRIVE